MKKSQLKALIKECVREVILEETGIVAHLVTETAKGLISQPVIKEEKAPQIDVEMERMRAINQAAHKRGERKRMINDAIGADAYGGIDIFEGVEPLASGGDEGSGGSGNSSLAGIAPNDPGIDISGIMNVGNASKWIRIVTGKQ